MSTPKRLEDGDDFLDPEDSILLGFTSPTTEFTSLFHAFGGDEKSGVLGRFSGQYHERFPEEPIKIYDRQAKYNAVIACIKSGYSARHILRLTGIHKATQKIYRLKFERESGQKSKCGCGGEYTHRGWCWFRYSLSPARRDYVKNYLGRGNRKEIGGEKLGQMALWYKDGVSPEQLAHYFGIGVVRVKLELKKQNMKMRRTINPVSGEGRSGYRLVPRAVYNSWNSMIGRCYHKNNSGYPLYGGRGIVVCDRWRGGAENFYADMGDRPEGKSLDRINVNGHYEPSNCRWATAQEQANNTRKQLGALVSDRAQMAKFSVVPLIGQSD